MQYNTQQKRMPLPEYGRSIQNMVDYALTIQDRAERQRCANTIINIMGNMFPHLRDVPDFKHKLWDHLAIMSGFELDIDYPYEIIRKDNLVTRPDHIPYSTARMRYRHYGHTLEVLIKKAIEFPEGNEKEKPDCPYLQPHEKGLPGMEQRYSGRQKDCRRPVRTVQRGTPNDRRYRPADGRTPESELPSEDELYQQSSKQ